MGSLGQNFEPIPGSGEPRLDVDLTWACGKSWQCSFASSGFQDLKIK